MKKLGLFRIFITIILSLVVGIAYIVISGLLLHSNFTVSFIDSEKTYESNEVLSGYDDFDNSKVFSDIYTLQMQDVIVYSAVKNVLDNDKVEVASFFYGNDYANREGILVEYYVDDIIKWGRDGYTYSTRVFDEKNFLKMFPDSSYSVDEILKYSSDFVKTTEDEKGNLSITVYMLNSDYASVSGEKDLTKLVDNWISYFELEQSITYTCQRFSEYYELYRQGSSLYDSSYMNMKYIIRSGENDDLKTYTNIDTSVIDSANMTDDELIDIFSDYRNFIVYFPDKLEYYTFSNVQESDLYLYVKLYADELASPIRMFAYVDEDYSYESDAFAVAYNTAIARSEETFRGIIVLAIIFVVFLIGCIYLGISSGRNSKYGIYHIFLDKIWMEVFAIGFVLLILLDRYVFRSLKLGSIGNKIWSINTNGVNTPQDNFINAFESGNFGYYFLFLSLGFFTAFIFIIMLCSFIRRIKNNILRDYLFLNSLQNIVSKIINLLERNENVAVRSMVPFHLFLVFNLLMTFWLVTLVLSKAYLGVVFVALFLIIVDAFSAIRQYKKASDMKAIFDGLKRIGDGDLDYKINEAELLEINKDKAEIVNTIGDGISSAVNTSMKDEKMKSDLITNVSHDLKTPLTSIINYVGLLKDEGIDAQPAKGYIDTLEDKAIRLKLLLQDLIDASRLTSGNVDVKPSKIIVGELLHQVVAEYSDRLDEKKLTVIFDGFTNRYISVDGRHMWRIMDNLFGNICKYSLYGTRVYVSVNEIEDKCLISVKNVSEKPNTLQGNELTEKFIRGDSSRSSEGSGLGLFIAKSLTELQSGEFEVIADGDLFKVNLSFPFAED